MELLDHFLLFGMIRCTEKTYCKFVCIKNIIVYLKQHIKSTKKKLLRGWDRSLICDSFRQEIENTNMVRLY